MSVRVRLTRVGSKKNPIWRVVVADQRSPRDGRFIETIGHYNPQTEPSTIRIDEKELDRLEAIIRSMTPQERANPAIINGSRRRRIARGSGTSVQAVSHLVKQFSQMKKLMKQISRGKIPDLQQLASGR